MSSKAWFLHVDGEALGPFSVGMLTKMITQGKATITDFVWCEGLPQWTIIAACEDFAAVLPEAPSTPLPNEEVEEAPAPKPVAKAKPAPVKAKPVAAPVKAKAKPVVVEPEPEPEVEEAVEEEVVEAVAEEEVEETPAPPPKPATKPIAKPVAIKPAAPKPAPKPKVMVRVWMKPIDAKVRVNGGKPVKVLDLTETGLILEHTDGAEMGADVKLRVEGPSFAKPLDLTAVVTRDEAFEGKPALGVEFTRMNPAHRRTLAQYISERMEDQAA